MMPDFQDISIIGGADGPTAVMVAGSHCKPLALAGLAIAAIILIVIFLKHNN